MTNRWIKVEQYRRHQQLPKNVIGSLLSLVHTEPAQFFQVVTGEIKSNRMIDEFNDPLSRTLMCDGGATGNIVEGREKFSVGHQLGSRITTS
ncbi:hypothetical protein D3C78_1346580 [compost metagenome]